tara:strand:- start:711 stop:1040 length:330 start_codon:yes stop_codon:yes gene_type:complete
MIVTIHYIWSFLKTNLTIPKTKDLVKKPTELYKDIYSTMNNTDSNKKEDMKNELRNYIGTLKDDKNNQNENENEKISSGFQNDNYFNWNNNGLDNDDDELTMDLTSRIK